MISSSRMRRACTHKIAIWFNDLINVCFGSFAESSQTSPEVREEALARFFARSNSIAGVIDVFFLMNIRIQIIKPSEARNAITQRTVSGPVLSRHWPQFRWSRLA